MREKIQNYHARKPRLQLTVRSLESIVSSGGDGCVVVEVRRGRIRQLQPCRGKIGGMPSDVPPSDLHSYEPAGMMRAAAALRISGVKRIMNAVVMVSFRLVGVAGLTVTLAGSASVMHPDAKSLDAFGG